LLLTTTVLIYKKQEELAMTMAILWRKKLVLHSSLVGVFIGISENLIMLANSDRPRDLLSSARRRTVAWNEQRLAGRRSRRGAGAATIRLRYGGGRRRERLVGPRDSKKGKKILFFGVFEY
jgi:hypothetical protein